MKKLVLLYVLFTFSLSGFSQRSIQSLNSSWEFTSEANQGKSKIVNIPHTWNNEDAFRDGKEYFRGLGVYRKTLFIPQEWSNKRVFLKFEGSNQITRLFVNEQPAGTHKGGYTGFVFDITEQLVPGEENELRIEVDNSHNLDIPPLDADFNFYGGIYRDLSLIITEEVHFELANEAAGNLLVRTSEVSEDKAKIGIEAKLVNHSDSTEKTEVEVEIFNPGGESIKTLSRSLRLQPGGTETLNFEHLITAPELWSPDNPQLYRMVASIYTEGKKEKTDVFETNFGLRWVEIDAEKGFFLNGKPLKLIGANRHQDFLGLGNALPNELHERDYRMIKEMGANFIRTAHYPQDPEVYRICDELGLLVWTEVPVINDVTDSEAYHEVSLQMQREQILQFFNHPSIVMWGLMNEIFIRLVFNGKVSEEDREAKIKTTVALAEKLERETKRLDPSRLSAMALHQDELYNSTGIADIPDVIGWNLYMGWYSPGLENLGKFLDEQHQRYPNRPLLISEYGPGADIRLQTMDPKPWDYSEAYQLKSHRSYLNQVQERDYMLGMAAWNFADFGSSFRQDAMPYINQKGLVNFDRTKKDIYYYYQARLTEQPMVYISGENFETRYIQKQGDKAEFKVFSNQDKVELKVDGGESFTSETVDGIASFELSLQEGVHQLTATAGEASHSREIEIRYREQLVPEIGKKDILVNVGTHVNYRDPVTGEIWISDQPYSEGGFGYIGGEVYQKSKDKFQGTASDIQGTENDPLFQTMQEGIEAYKFDVEPGTYRVTLLFAEPEWNASEENIYNLGKAEAEATEGLRSFDIRINGELQRGDLNLARDYGRVRAVELWFEVRTQGGINVEFEENAGESLLSGIKLEQL